jgi:hypothetical protein
LQEVDSPTLRAGGVLAQNEERKRVVRAFVDGLTLCGSNRTGELRIRELPARATLGTGSSVNMVAGVRCEARQTNLPWELELVLMAFETRGTALVPVGQDEGLQCSSR